MRSKYIPALALTFVALIVFSNLLYANNIKNWSKVTSEERELGDFDRIEIDGSVDLKITVGESQKITVTAEEKYLDKIRTRIAGHNRLLITSSRFRSRVDALIEIQVPELKNLSVFGSSDVLVTSLDNDKFDLYIDGSGDVTLNGEVEEVEIAIDGSGDVDASELEVESAYIDISGSGDVDIQAEEVYEQNYGSGEIYFHGRDPQIIIRDYNRNQHHNWRYFAPGVMYVPDIPAVPALPSIPAVPAIPALPSIPAVPELPEINVPDFDNADLSDWYDMKDLRERTKHKVPD